jgi:hypothetical protein
VGFLILPIKRALSELPITDCYRNPSEQLNTVYESDALKNLVT